MNNDYFFVQDLAGNQQKVRALSPSPEHDGSSTGAAHVSYALDDGSAVERIDSDTFRIIGSGALVTLVRA
ncbi:MAG: hypothetical protein ABIP44_10315 [Pseudoxanthomonas sp.]